MQTTFLLRKQNNTSLFPSVMQAFRKESVTTGVIFHRNLHWRLLSHEELSVEIHGAPVRDLPDPLKYASYELSFYDFRDDVILETGPYKLGQAKGRVVGWFPGTSSIYEVEIWSSRLHDLNELYRLILAGEIKPIQS